MVVENLDRIKNLEANWLKELPLKDMIKFGWIAKSENLFKDCLNFFQVSNVNEWKEKYPQINFKTENLKYDSLLSFTQSFTAEVEFVNTEVK